MNFLREPPPKKDTQTSLQLLDSPDMAVGSLFHHIHVHCSAAFTWVDCPTERSQITLEAPILEVLFTCVSQTNSGLIARLLASAASFAE